ncbi:MAG: alanine--tRNA ligase [Candidatus Kapabacteria bacterium]|nr:alanine--tRNA ligase [Ignavibacteriota bacterium]MCW5884582.1 alanine--tRNA ligase [Candidatus Kapabacteria bacterium]
MTSQEIRQSFLDFFKEKQHRIIPSAPVIPHGDPTLLFTNAGMNQFKDVFLGVGSRDYVRAADTQKCIRVSGKHNDLEEVGVDTYHHTFFEMLGNWSFGDYYKIEAIDFAWELLTKVWGLPVERLHATVYKTDDEAFEIWKNYLPESQIHRFAEKDNFWEMGETGPCGPCSEVHFDRTPDLSGGKLVNAGVPEVIEIWNLVFIQYNRKNSGELEPLSSTHVDTGMGFERICAVIQGKESNYDTDVFMPLINEIAKLSGKKYDGGLTDPDSIAMRVIADHVRTLSFAIADGALPGNEGRGYVLRRILRRGCRFARNLGFRQPVIYKLLPILENIMADVFPEIKEQMPTIERIIKGEEESFLQTLDRGIEIFEEKSNDTISSGYNIVSGADAFLLYDTYGFPYDLTELLAREKNLTIDKAGFDELMKQQKERSRASRKSAAEEVELPNVKFDCKFIGYSNIEAESEVLFVKDNLLVTAETPFYAESGGQISDTGTATLAGEVYNVLDMRKIGNTIFHICDRDIENLIGTIALLKVDSKRRKNIMRNHSATHLMHEALRELLGNHVQQAGSLVAPDYLRFDFNHFEKVKPEQIKEIENIVNSKILENINISIEEKELEKAREISKIKMFFGDKYGDTVRVVTMDPKFSMELCGGTHVSNTAEIALFKIISESSVAAGVRRIEAITGDAVNEYIHDLSDKILESEKAKEELNHRIKQLEKEISELKLADKSGELSNLIQTGILYNGIKIVCSIVDAENLDELRNLGDSLRNELGKSGIGLLAAEIEGKAQMVCVATDDIKDKYPAGKLIGIAAKELGGGGGGKPHLATAGGKDVDKLPNLIKIFPEMVKNYN